MKKTLKGLAMAVLVIIMSMLLVACGGDETETTTTTTEKGPVKLPEEGAAYTAEWVAELLNGITEEIGGRLLAGDKSNTINPIDSFSMENFVYNGETEVKYDKIYTDGSIKYTVTKIPTENGEQDITTIEKAYKDFTAYIETVNQKTFGTAYYTGDSGIAAGMLTEEQLLMLKLSDSDLEASVSSPNLFVFSDDFILDFMNVYAGANIYKASDIDGAYMNVDLMKYEESGHVYLYITPPEDYGADAMIIDMDLSDYRDGMGTINIDLEVEDTIYIDITLEKGKNRAEKLSFSVKSMEDGVAYISEMHLEYKGDDYILPEDPDHSQCDAIIYEIKERVDNVDQYSVKIVAARTEDGAVKGKMKIYSGENSGNVEGISAVASTLSDLSMDGVFDACLNEDGEIISLDAVFDIEKGTLSGDAEAHYSKAYMEEAGKYPLTLIIDGNGEVTEISLRTVAFSGGKGEYELYYSDGGVSISADVSVPGIRFFEYTEKEALYLKRANEHFKDAQRSLGYFYNLNAASASYIQECIQNGTPIRSFVSCLDDCKYCYFTDIYEVEDVIYFNVYPVFDYEYYRFSYPTNIDTDTDVIFTPSGAESFAKSYSEKMFRAVKEKYTFSAISNFIVGMEIKEYGLYLYFESTNGRVWNITTEPISDENNEYDIHMVDEDLAYPYPEIVHDLVKGYNERCVVTYKCSICENKFYTDKTEHAFTDTVLWEADEDTAGCTLRDCTRCNKKELIYTDNDGTRITLALYWVHISGARVEYKVNILGCSDRADEFDGRVIIPYQIGEKAFITEVRIDTYDGDVAGLYLELEIQSGVKKIFAVPYCTRKLRLNSGIEEIDILALSDATELEVLDLNFTEAYWGYSIAPPKDLGILNFAGTRESFEIMGINTGDETVVNFNVVFE